MEEEKVLLEAVLCFPVRANSVLLARKTKKIGVGCWNGYGGGLESGEVSEAAAVRELAEESGLHASVQDIHKVAIIDFHNTKSDGGMFTCKCHVFLVTRWDGEPRATDEMASPTWFDIDNLPYGEMMPADRIWLPPALRGTKIIASAHYGPWQRALLGDVIVTPVDSF
ncbi:MAG: NUDIX domain-containing protein [bacterium]|nr:NUDIX domain-containing protein [bacterium]